MSESFDVRIITASYRREPVDGPEDPQVPVIQLFGRTREGKSIAIEYSGFKPYFFVVAPPQALRGAFARDKQVVAFEDVTLEVEGRPTPCARVVLRQPWKTPEYREKARKFGSTPLEADIPFQHRFIYDMDLGAAVRVVGTTQDPKGHYWTDLFLVAERFEPCDPFRPALRILSFDIENSIRDGHIFCIGVAYREAGEIKTRILTGNEKEIIERFVKLIDELYEPLDDLLLVAGEDAGLDLARFAVCDPDAEDVAVPDRIFDVKAEDPEGGTERVARLEPFGHKEQVCPVTSLRILGRSHYSDGRPEIHIIDEPMLERDVRFQRSRSELACLFPVFRRLPGLSEDHAGAGRRPTFDLQGDVLEGDDLFVAGERPSKRLRRRDDEEVRLESGVFDR